MTTGCGYVLWRGGERFPQPVLAGLALLGVYWLRNDPLGNPTPRTSMGLALFHAGVAGSCAFLWAHRAPPPSSWPALVVAAAVGGGAVAYASWLFGALALAGAVMAWRRLQELLHHPDWDGVA